MLEKINEHAGEEDENARSGRYNNGIDVHRFRDRGLKKKKEPRFESRKTDKKKR